MDKASGFTAAQKYDLHQICTKTQKRCWIYRLFSGVAIIYMNSGPRDRKNRPLLKSNRRLACAELCAAIALQ